MHIRILDFVDIFLVAVLLFVLYKLLRGTAAINILFGLVAIFLLWKITYILKMELLSDILGAFISVGIIALIIIFQPEIRQFLLALGSPTFFNTKGKRFSFLKRWFPDEFSLDVDPIVVACQHMSNARQGALIVITRQNELSNVILSGEIIDGTITSPLIENVFFKNSPLHDGAMVITQNRIKAAGCVLPVTKRKLPRYAGLRHRAAIGITEISDAIAIIVSEETGQISYCVQGNLRHDINVATLQQKLLIELGMADPTEVEVVSSDSENETTTEEKPEKHETDTKSDNPQL
ncbi:MAG: diadenylate cyclase CdaA [Bacteroidales bacterium]|nr:diadenylate cyclase CdaA [Bacteroidales bacterium]